MKIIFMLKESIFDCKLQITDLQGSRYYLISPFSENDISQQYLTIDIYGTEFDLTLTPLMPDINSALDEIEENSWLDKLAKNAGKLLGKSLDKILLRVGCTYHIQDAQQGDRLDITMQGYPFGTFDRFGLLELLPMIYFFFEVSSFNKRFKPLKAFETNRKDVIKASRVLALSMSLGNSILAPFSYMIQMSRIKRLSKNRKIFRVISKFHNMSDAERKKFEEKIDKLVDW
ncbi:MAG: hypothetical protein E7539_05850 [Ruminococcaceae bacterium]|nr:hypothetical protein [Oscillospiraceae bacterium]